MLKLKFIFALLPALLVWPAFAQINEVTAVPTPEEVELVLEPRDYSPAEIKLLQELEHRRIELDRRAKAIDLRERLVDLAEERLIAKVDQLSKLQDDVKKLLMNLSDKEEEELNQLAKIYESMKPQAAADVLNRLDNAIVYDLFRRMKSKNTAKIMEKMVPGKARLISEMLAEKSELPPLAATPQ